ncbi:hypothetical protein [Nocardia sp. NPDC057455]|uniref:hypothetical protein n=1 Tax=Nocardia sp. NPDC057455 TaxID=3346138 RepID=UPI00366C7E53
MLVGLAVLSLLSEFASAGSIVCLVDDAQWLDRPSAEALLFAALRLDAEGIVLIIAARAGLAAPLLAQLDESTAAGLLAEHAATLSAADRYRVLAQAQGNPLALLSLPAALGTDRPLAPARPCP